MTLKDFFNEEVWDSFDEKDTWYTPCASEFTLKKSINFDNPTSKI
eukprot:CAMPEP_0203747338 /NCGR_PEP_ID=MMETSP0098-20131031/2521_1 /ASSEMBLY_ACC=CAM_ASM_000208 /TAXON_ID=96639 /ORGANISM=" , Strain NY0313808BC1" /LENGTH=44 /DNA_ID= /DNA_START= /DNA_END= /DNA_ORIENTATION=